MNLDCLENRHTEVLELLDTLVRLGAPTFQEKRRSDFMLNWLREHVPTGEAGQDADGNVWVDLSGGDGRVHLFDSHIDTVFSHRDLEITKEEGRWHCPGIFDNTVTCAQLMIWARAMAEQGRPVPVVIVFSVGEEGEGNLLGARAMARKFKDRAMDAIAFDLSLTRASREAVGSNRNELTFQVTGGHSWGDFGRPNAIHEAARSILRLENAFPWKRGERSFNVGSITGGTGINVIAGAASFKLDVRSTDPAFLTAFGEWLEAEAARLPEGVALTIRPIGIRPAGRLEGGHPLVALVEETQRDLGWPLSWAAYSTNGNAYLDAGIPTVVTGLGEGSGIHTEKEFLELSSIPNGWKKLVRIGARITGS